MTGQERAKPGRPSLRSPPAGDTLGGLKIKDLINEAARQGGGPAPRSDHARGSRGDDRRGQRRPVAPGLSRTAGGGPRGAPGDPGRVSHLALHLEGHLAELDINPLMVLPLGQGVKAADALVVFRGT